jgi:hypothetical protein
LSNHYCQKPKWMGEKIKEGLQLIHTEIPCFTEETKVWSNVLYNHIKKIQRIQINTSNKRCCSIKLYSGVNRAPTDGTRLKILSTFTTCLSCNKEIISILLLQKYEMKLKIEYIPKLVPCKKKRRPRPILFDLRIWMWTK